jgi:Putative beta-lactamase-inhibitor-like, PepSY-like
MRTIKTTGFTITTILLLSILFTSCNKENSTNNSSGTSVSLSSGTVGVGISTTTNDSIYVVGACAAHHHLDSVAAASLPSSITDYLSANYQGYVFQKAFTDVDTTGTLSGYVVIIQYNGNPVGLKFDASGNFVKVLEQREGADLSGRGWHEGGCFDDRDGRQRDSVAIAALPGAITTYLSTNYPQDTIVKAFRGRDSSYILYSFDNGVYATVFDATGTFVSRTILEPRHDDFMVIAPSGLPATILSYLTAAYPGYVIKQSFAYAENGRLAGYVIGIDANNTRYALQFDVSGNFIRAVTIP